VIDMAMMYCNSETFLLFFAIGMTDHCLDAKNAEMKTWTSVSV